MILQRGAAGIGLEFESNGSVKCLFDTLKRIGESCGYGVTLEYRPNTGWEVWGKTEDSETATLLYGPTKHPRQAIARALVSLKTP